MISNILISKKFILSSIVAVGLVVGITIGLVLLPLSRDDSSSLPSSASAQEENSIVPLDQIVSGGPPPDGIPSIDNP